LLVAVGASRAAATAWAHIDEVARRIGDRAAHIEALDHLASIELLLGDYPASRRHAEAMLALTGSDDTGASAERAVALGYLGSLSRRNGELDAALAFHSRAVAILRERGDEVHLARALSSLGTVLRDRGDFAGALDAHLQALDLRERSGDQLETSYRNIGLLYREIEDEQGARAYFRKALEVAASRSDPETYASVLGSHASLLNDVGDHAAALAAAEEGLIIDVAVASRSHEGLQNLEAGRALLGLGRNVEAIRRLQTALAIGREINQGEIIARALLHLAEEAQGGRDVLRARGYIDEAIARLESIQLRPQLAQAYAIRERIALAQHDTEAALRYAHRHSEQRELLLGTRASRQLAALQARHARDESVQKLALLQKDNELQAAKLHTRELRQQLSYGALASLLLLLGLTAWRFAGMRRLNETLAAQNAEIENQREALAEANDQLSERAAALYQAAIRDPLTGVWNRAHLHEQLGRRLTSCLAEAREFAVLVVDFDHFKQVNDAYGHLRGDRVLVAGIAAIRSCLRGEDVLGRFGGEEFVIGLEGHSAEAAEAIGERLREEVEARLAGAGPGAIHVTVSVGLAVASQFARPTVDALLDAADRAMYAAKAAGRNRVVRYASAA
ncbi:MAG: diguanylate cyclase, partial [Xanthomonadales bacterium]|nr:diguanylate cyclase [Xanthomonadales bacterium]